MVAPPEIIFVEFLRTVKIAIYINTTVIIIIMVKIFHNINFIVH